MLVLLFYLGDIKYTIKTINIREITPVVMLKKVPGAPAVFAGLFNYRGLIVPVIDLRQLIQGTSCKMRMSTRIILVDYVKKESNKVIGFLAERVTEAVIKPIDAFVPVGITLPKAPYLSEMVMDNGKMIQHIDLEMLPKCLECLPMSDETAEKTAVDEEY